MYVGIDASVGNTMLQKIEKEIKMEFTIENFNKLLKERSDLNRELLKNRIYTIMREYPNCCNWNTVGHAFPDLFDMKDTEECEGNCNQCREEFYIKMDEYINTRYPESDKKED